MKKNNTIDNLHDTLLENRRKQNARFRRKKKIVLFSFFSFLFVLTISVFIYKFSTAEIEFNQNINLKYVDNVVYLSVSNFEAELIQNEELKQDNVPEFNPEFIKQYVVQLGVFKDLDNVDKFKRSLEKKGHSVYYEKNESYYRVRLLKTFNTRVGAEKYAENLKKTKLVNEYWVRLK